jgi:hypothetical protein
LAAIIDNLRDRIEEVRLNGWQGEVQGLSTSLGNAVQKLVSLNRTRERQETGPVNLGIPVITDPGSSPKMTTHRARSTRLTP